MICYSLSAGGQTIQQASRSGDLETVKRFLNNDPAAVNSMDGDKMMPLHHAADAGQVEITRLLLEHGANVEALNYKSETPLHVAAYKGHAGVVKTTLRVVRGAPFGRLARCGRLRVWDVVLHRPVEHRTSVAVLARCRRRALPEQLHVLPSHPGQIAPVTR